MKKKIELDALTIETIIEALSIAYLKTGERKYDKIRSYVLNKKVEALFDVEPKT